MRAVITVVGKDSVGILAKVSAKCAESNVNINDITTIIIELIAIARFEFEYHFCIYYPSLIYKPSIRNFSLKKDTKIILISQLTKYNNNCIYILY